MTTYDRYYRELFKARMVATIGVVGSSDSGYIDSVFRVIKRWRLADSIAKMAGNKPPEEPYIPWNVHPEKNLPRAITVHTDTLLSKEFTRPIKTNLGFFLARVQEIKLIKEVSFREAYAKLVYLATRDKLLGMDSVIAAKSL